MPSYADNVKNFYVYQYQHIDDLSSIRSPEDFFRHGTPFGIGIPQMVALVSQRLKEGGWEGDGEIGIIWLPPFVDVGIEETTGNYVWHVKQENNGTSFLASSFPLAFRRIEQQNPA